TAVVDQGSISADEYDTQFVLVKQLTDGWDGIDTDMTDLLDRMDRNMGNYHDVAALPSFDLFPWFFVLPGVFVAALSVAWMLSKRRWLGWALVAMGLGIVAAPAIGSAAGLVDIAYVGRCPAEGWMPCPRVTRLSSSVMWSRSLAVAS
ncbi:MAG TPA: hypothetical protein PKB00_16840, partial [Microthrixaceae bacterium]|nr:hypothetical protein [Microthrixaceae bacterium]